MARLASRELDLARESVLTQTLSSGVHGLYTSPGVRVPVTDLLGKLREVLSVPFGTVFDMTVPNVTFSFRCGHCGVTSARKSVGDLDERGLRGTPVWVQVLECAGCGFYTLRAQEKSPPDREWYFPPEGHQLVRNVDRVPDLIRADYQEAVDCLVGGQYKAAAVMARRAVQGVCLDLEAPDDKLFAQIDHLASQGELTKRLKALAETIRVLGNDGAHPRDDGLDELSVDDARKAVRFLEHMLDHVYIIDVEV